MAHPAPSSSGAATVAVAALALLLVATIVAAACGGIAAREAPDPTPAATTPGTAGMAAPAAPEAGDGGASGLLYPDLRVQTLTDLAFDVAYINGEPRRVVRFTTTITNTGTGPLELHSSLDEGTQRTVVTQRIYGPGQQTPEDRRVGAFVYHPGHAHWHMDEFVTYRLYAFGDDGAEERATAKTSFCLTDDHQALELNAAPDEAQYGGCDNRVQGISVGWNDIYLSDLIDQWVDLGPAAGDGAPHLPDGEYAIVADVSPTRLVAESDSTNNTSVTYFSVTDGELMADG
ncbi:MAG TPA: lysyl oxidase family protein [Dehalococcoidia bacterium]|nr:lysyl oxidase family protein [Dehalococcoidia bacterium]